jgi:6-phosphogluconolactonase (cycloisomerase 2 family)
MKVIALLLLISLASVYAQTRVGSVFAITNERLNRLVVFPRNSDGSLGSPSYVNTTGFGTGLSPLAEPLGPQNPFDTQNAVIRNFAGTRIYAVNAGSNSVTSFIVTAAGGATVETVYDSGGEHPVTLAISHDDRTLYVVNTGAYSRLVSIPLRAQRQTYVTKISGAVTLFQSTPIFPQTPPQSLSSAGDVTVSPDDRWVLVSEKQASTVTAYRVTAGGRLLPRQLRAPVVTRNNRAFSWPIVWVDNTTILLAAFGPDALNDPSYAQTYRFDSTTGSLTLINELVIPTNANCWWAKWNNYYYGASIVQFQPVVRVDPVTYTITLAGDPALAAGHARDAAIGYNDIYAIDGVLYNLGWLGAAPHTMYAFRINEANGAVTLINSNNEAPIAQGCVAI